jgi:hypothetical protein
LAVEFRRDPERYATPDWSIFRFWDVDEETEEPIAQFYQDGSLNLPDIDQHVSFIRREGRESESDGEGDSDPINEYRVDDIEHAYVLHEWIDEDDDEVDAMYGITDIFVEGPIEDGSE